LEKKEEENFAANFFIVFLLSPLISNTENAAIGTILIMTGLSLYVFWKYLKKNK
jgi:positive regulator of sigma E activity